MGRQRSTIAITIKQYMLMAEGGDDRWTFYRFTRNVYDIFASNHLERIKSAINQLSDLPLISAPSTTSIVGGIFASSAPPDTMATTASTEAGSLVVSPDLRAMLRQVEQHQVEGAAQRDYFKLQLEQQQQRFLDLEESHRAEDLKHEEKALEREERHRADVEAHRNDLLLTSFNREHKCNPAPTSSRIAN